MEFTRQRVIVIIIGVIIIIIAGLYLFLYKPIISRLRTARSECCVIEADVAQARQSTDSVKMADIKGGLITEEEISFAIDELTRQGKLEDVNFISMKPGEIEKSKGPYEILPIEIEAESLYDRLGTFLGTLDELERSLVTIRSFKITPAKADPSRLRSELVVNMYIAGKKDAK
jgi:Tfp pilus assembly protein PilO